VRCSDYPFYETWVDRLAGWSALPAGASRTENGPLGRNSDPLGLDAADIRDLAEDSEGKMKDTSIRIATDECVDRVERFWTLVREEAKKANLAIGVQDGCLWISISDELRPTTHRDITEWPFVAWIEDGGEIIFSEVESDLYPEDFKSLAKARASGEAW